MSETNSSSFDLNAFIKDSKETLVNPKSYFSTMPTSGGMAELRWSNETGQFINQI
jgi:hypothetical protein